MALQVLFTQGLSNVHYAITLIRKAMAPDEFQLNASYSTPYTTLQTVADGFFPEPRIGGETYLHWLLDNCRAWHIDLLWPQSRLPLLLAHRHILQDAGITTLFPCADPDTLAILNDKIAMARALQSLPIALPQWRSFRTPEELDDALISLGYPDNRVCIKPAVSICAQGFRILDSNRDRFTRFMQNDVITMSLDELKGLLAIRRNPPTFLAMEYLEGDERSIDCLAVNGHLIRSVIRRKPRRFKSHIEVIEANAESQAIAAKVCQAFALNGVVNVQTMERLLPDGKREQCFMEVNPRMSGGINMACLSDVNLPYWALRLAAGTATPVEIPQPRTGQLVTTVYEALALDNLDLTGFSSAETDLNRPDSISDSGYSR